MGHRLPNVGPFNSMFLVSEQWFSLVQIQFLKIVKDSPFLQLLRTEDHYDRWWWWCWWLIDWWWIIWFFATQGATWSLVAWLRFGDEVWVLLNGICWYFHLLAFEAHVHVLCFVKVELFSICRMDGWSLQWCQLRVRLEVTSIEVSVVIHIFVWMDAWDLNIINGNT